MMSLSDSLCGHVGDFYGSWEGETVEVALLNELFLSVCLILGKVWSIFPIAWHLEWVPGKQDNSVEVGGS